MSEERPESCFKCNAPEPWCSCGRFTGSLEYIRELAARPLHVDDAAYFPARSENYDDAYRDGGHDAEGILARRVLPEVESVHAELARLRQFRDDVLTVEQDDEERRYGKSSQDLADITAYYASTAAAIRQRKEGA